jgi:tetratricopeptide (TPR) repeat protein
VAAALALEGGTPAARLRALNAAGVLAGEAGDAAEARERFEGSVELARATGDEEAAARAGSNLGTLALYAGDLAEAARRYEGSVGYWRRVGDTWGVSLNLQNLALARDGLGDRPAALELLTSSLALAREAADPAHIASALRSLARLLLKDRRESADAVAFLRESLERSRELDDRPGIVECLETLAAVAGRAGDAVTGSVLTGAADALRGESGATEQPNEAAWVREQTAALRSALGERRFADALAEGRRLDAAEAVRRALALAG